MRWSEYINSDEVIKAISVLQAPGKPFEVRVIGTAGKKDILSGYFVDAKTLLQKFDSIDVRNRNIYITLGELKDECFSRSQSERFERTDSTTSDTEIVRYRWLFVDLDPVRTAGISSSDEELQKAKELSDVVYQYMQGIGFEEPVKAMSGNGFHLLYRIDVPNDASGRGLIEKCLKNLSRIFNTDSVKIDTTNSNPSRICKLHGTLAQKGRSTRNRPHRMSRLISVPDEVCVSKMETLQTLADELPDDPKPEPNRRGYGGMQQSFDLLGFMAMHGITYKEDTGDRASKIYKLDECPFNPQHRNGDAKIFQYSDGKIAFKCHHNSCKQYVWQDVRLKFEPNAYDYIQDAERIEAGYQKHLQKLDQEPVALEPENDLTKPTQKIVFRDLKTAEALMLKDIPEPKVFIGLDNELPFLVEGTCILSAKPKLGKSWLALAICLKVAAGKDFLGYKTRKCSTLYLDLETSESLQQKRLRKMLKGADPPKNFYLETETLTMEQGFVAQIEHYLEQDPDIGVVVIDVFQIIRTPSKSNKETEYEHAYRDITPLNELAQRKHISIILVCHDRKAVDPDDPFSNILGSTGLQGAATQMIVMFRKRKDDPIHISIKGKTIDGLPELDVKLSEAEWSVMEGGSSAAREQAETQAEYLASNVRKAVLAILNDETVWKGRCSELINDAIRYDIPLTEGAKFVGGFLHKHQGRFLKEDGVKIDIIDKGTASKIYKLEKSTISTISKNEEQPLLGFESIDESRLSEIPFL